MVKLRNIVVHCLFAIFITLPAWADPAMDAVLDDLQRGSGSSYSYSTTGRCTTTKNCISYFQQKLRQLSDKYANDQKKLDPATRQDDIAFLEQKQAAARSLSQQVPALLKSAIFYPQAIIFQTMSIQGQAKYRQGYRFNIPNLDDGFDILKIDSSKLGETDATILKLLQEEVQHLINTQQSNMQLPYIIRHIKGITFSYDDILNNILDRLDTQDYTHMDRESALQLQLNIIDDVRSRLAADDPNISRLQTLRSKIETEGNKPPVTIDDLILFLQTNDLTYPLNLENISEHNWQNISQGFQQATSPQFPTISNLANLSFDVIISDKTYNLSAKNVETRAKERERIYSQMIVYRDMSPTAQADYRIGKRYTLDRSQVTQHLFDPLKIRGTDATTQTILNKLQDEIIEVLKIDLKVKTPPSYQVIDIMNAHYEYDHVLNSILQEIDSIQNRPADRQVNIIIDLGIMDKYLQQLDPADKTYQKLLTLRQKIETGQDTTLTTRYTTGYGSQPRPSRSQSKEDWLNLQKQLASAQSPQPAKITNLNDITVKVNAAGKTYTISLADAGTLHYAQRRLAASTKYAGEKTEILKQLVQNLKSANCRTRDDCRKAYNDEIKSMKAQFGRSSYGSYGYQATATSRPGTPKSQEIDSAVQEMLKNFATVINNAFDMDRPQTKLMIYNKLSENGKAAYLDGTRISDPKEARIFKRDQTKQKQKTDKTGMVRSVLSIFGIGDPVPIAPQQPKQIDYAAAEKQLIPHAFFAADDILIYTMQALDRSGSACRAYSDCANNDIRVIDSIIRTLNQKDPVVNILNEIIDDIKEGQKTNPLDLDSIAQAFKKANFSPKLILESQDAYTWENIEAKKNKTRKTPVPPRVTNAQKLVDYYNKKIREQAGRAGSDPAALSSVIEGPIGSALKGAFGGSSSKPSTPQRPRPSYR